MHDNLVLQVVLIFILIGMNAFFAASEIAIISLNENRLKKWADNGNKRAQKLFELVSEPSRFLATIQVGITFAGFLASAAAAQGFSDELAGFLAWLGVPLPYGLISSISLIFVVIALSYITLVLGELVPKRLAMQKPEQISMFSVGPLSFISRFTSPFVRLLTASTNFVVRFFDGPPPDQDKKITEEEIRLMIDVGEEKGLIRETEKEMIDNIFEFDDIQVSRIMTHRTDIAALEADDNLERVLDVVKREQYSRIPVYENGMDNIIGILYIKDLLYLINSNEKEQFNLRNLIREPVFVPASKKTDQVFKELQRRKSHIAVIIDEYGGTAGLVTIEDLIEEIVGNIFDEYDEEEIDIQKIDQNTFMVNGTADLCDVRELLEVELPVDEYDTLGGFIIGQLGRIPLQGEKPIVEYDTLVFKVEEVSEKRISRVKVCKS